MMFGITIVLKYPRLSLCDICFYREIVKVGIMSLMVLESNQLCIYQKKCVLSTYTNYRSNQPFRYAILDFKELKNKR